MQNGVKHSGSLISKSLPIKKNSIVNCCYSACNKDFHVLLWHSCKVAMEKTGKNDDWIVISYSFIPFRRDRKQVSGMVVPCFCDYMNNMPQTLADTCFQFAIIGVEENRLIGDMGIVFTNHNKAQTGITNPVKQYEPADFKVFEHWVYDYMTNWTDCDMLCNHTIASFVMMYPEYISELKNGQRLKKSLPYTKKK